MDDMPNELPAQPAGEDGDGTEVAAAVARAREAKKERRRAERERQRAAQPKPRPVISTDLTTVSGAWERRSQQDARSSARVDMWTDSRRIISSIAVDGTVRTEVFELVGDEWTSLGAIALNAPST